MGKRADTKTDSHSLEFAEAMLQNGLVGLALFDAQDFRLLAANAPYHHFMNEFLEMEWQHGSAVGHPFTDWLPGAEKIGIVAIFRTVRESGIAFRDGQFVCRHHVGYWNWNLDPVRDDSGNIVQLLHTAIDITPHVLERQHSERANAELSQANRTVEAERKRLEVIETVARSVREALDTESIGKAAIDALNAAYNPLSVCIYTADPLNHTLHRLHIRALDDTMETYVQHIPYDDSLLVSGAHERKDPIVFEDLQVVAAQGLIPARHPLVLRGIRGYICVPLWFKDYFEGAISAIFTKPIALSGVEARTLVGCAVHIASAMAYARMHASLEHERARFHAVIDQMPEGVLLCEAPGKRISYGNDAALRICGLPQEKVLGHTLEEVFQLIRLADEEQHPIPLSDYAIVRALRGETINNRETMMTRPDGASIVLLSSTVPLRGEQGEITGTISVFQDITERKNIEQQKNEFLSIASHELRTPTTTIYGFAQFLQKLRAKGHDLNSSQSLHALTLIYEQSRHLTRLLDQLLDLSRIENARLFLDITAHDLLATLKRVLGSQALISTRHDLRLALEGIEAGQKLMVFYDEDRIEQVLNNLITNAVKYSREESEIEVGIRYAPERAGEVLIWIKDQGIGIAPDELPFIFERFHRAANLDRSMRGLGIGLYLVSEFVTRHGGRIWVESIEGGGSTFFVTLPRAMVELSPAPDNTSRGEPSSDR